MSHIVTIQARLKDPQAIVAACHRLHLEAPTQGTTELFSGTASGWLVKLPGWQYPIVIDPVSGEVKYDNFEGQWGDSVEIARFMQAYSVEKCRAEGLKKGLLVTEQNLPDGSIKLQLRETGC